MSKEYNKINKVVTNLESGRYEPLGAEWCSSRLDWAWRFKKISRDEFDDLVDRITELFLEDSARIKYSEELYGISRMGKI